MCSLADAALYCPATARFCDSSESYKACGSDGICLCRDGTVADPAQGTLGGYADPFCVDAVLQCPATASVPPKVCDYGTFVSCSPAGECVCLEGQENLNGRCVGTYIPHTSAHTVIRTPCCCVALKFMFMHISSPIGCCSAVCFGS
jgi:hypothetical protein